jgi:hypothetical protein
MKRLAWLLAGLAAASPALSQELKIGFLAPMTGIFAQIGKDMENGFQMYLDEQKGTFAGAKDFHRRGRGRQAPVGVRKAEKLVRRTKACSSAACWPRPAMRWRRSAPPRRRSTSPPSRPPTT